VSIRGGVAPPADSAVAPTMYLQPIVDLASGRAVAVEALARFPGAPGTPVGHVFASARAFGGGVALEAACLRTARGLLPTVPDGVELAVNVSPDAVEHPLVQAALAGDLSRIIVEVTEQPASDPARLQDTLAELRRRGARLAVDDVTTGHAGLMRLAQLRPDVIKIDRGAVRAIAGGTEQVAVVEALVSLGRRLGCLILAEGVESLDDLATLSRLDVDLAQGWAIAVPAPTFAPVGETVTAACLAARREMLRVELSPPQQPRAVDIHYVTAELAGTAHQGQLDRALALASATLGASSIGVSVLNDADELREIVVTSTQVDPESYRLVDYPATAAALRDGVMLEVQAKGSPVDAAELDVLHRLGMASLLLVPLILDHQPCGILEMFYEQPRRWTGRDLENARILAEHVLHALGRVTTG